MMKKNSKKSHKHKHVSDAVDQEKEHQHEVEESLRTIYEETEGEMPDMSRLEKVQSKRWIWITAAVSSFIIILIFAAWLGFSFYRSYHGFTGNGLMLSVEGPETIALGQETTYFINYQNPLSEPLTSVDVRVNFPSDFVITQVIPNPNAEGNVWEVGAMAGEERGTIKVRGRFIGALGTISAVQAIATYRPANYSSDFEAMATKQVSYDETVIEGWIQVPEKGVPGDHLTLLYNIKNTDQEGLKNVEARIEMPEGFTPDALTQGDERIEDGVFIKKISNLAAGSSTQIGVIGVFSAGFGGAAVVSGQVGTVNLEGVFLPMHKAEAEFPVLAGDLSLNFVVNGMDEVERSIAYGDVLQAAIGYENTADEQLKNVSVSILFETIDLNDNSVIEGVDLIDWDKWTKNSSSTRDGHTVTWDRESDVLLEDLSPRVGGSLAFTVPIVERVDDKRAIALRTTVMARVEAVGETEMNRTIKMEPYIFKLKSDAKLTAQARYFSEEGAPYGDGPLPPLVGQTTKYRVIWTIGKNVHALEDVDVSAILPRNVEFDSIATTTAGELVYNQNEKIVTWKLNRMPADVDYIESQFNIKLTPGAADDGRFADLTDDITFQAVDEDLKDSLLQVIKGLTTDLQSDEGAEGKGVVRKLVE